MLEPAQASCSLRAMWGLDAKAEGFRLCQRAGGGAASSMPAVWGARGRALTAVTPLPRQFLPLMPVSPAHYKAISSHLTASETDDELPSISLKQSFVPCAAGAAGDSKAPVEPIPLIARHAVTAAPAPEHHKGLPSPGSCLLEAALGIACLIDCLQCRAEFLMSRGNRKAEVSKQIQQESSHQASSTRALPGLPCAIW